MMERVSGLRRVKRFPQYLKKLLPGLFLQELYAQPDVIGAICPSSRFLAHRMAKEVAHLQDGLIVELGPGTGVVTQALLDRGVAADRLLAVESSLAFVQRLRKRFPHVNVVHGNASDLSQWLPPGTRVAAIVSSLPLCSLPQPIVRVILAQWHDLLHDGGIAVQFTYNLRRPRWHHHMQARQINTQIVWANLPPAQVSTYAFNTIKQAVIEHEQSGPEQTC